MSAQPRLVISKKGLMLLDQLEIRPMKHLPKWYKDRNIRAFVNESYGRLNALEVEKEGMRLFGLLSPGKSAIYRYWERLDAMPEISRLSSLQSRAIQAATQSSFGPECLPTYHGYHQEIPAGWTVRCVVFVQERCAPQKSDTPSALFDVHQDAFRMRAALVLSQSREVDQPKLQAFLEHDLPEAAFLDCSGRYLFPAQDRPDFAVLQLDTSTTGRSDQSGSGECLVLLPFVRFSTDLNRFYHPIKVFVDGCEISIGSGHPQVAGDLQ